MGGGWGWHLLTADLTDGFDGDVLTGSILRLGLGSHPSWHGGLGGPLHSCGQVGRERKGRREATGRRVQEGSHLHPVHGLPWPSVSWPIPDEPAGRAGSVQIWAGNGRDMPPGGECDKGTLYKGVGRVWKQQETAQHARQTGGEGSRVSPKIHIHPEPQTGNWFGDRVFADVIS